jgi:hypothetical protein
MNVSEILLRTVPQSHGRKSVLRRLLATALLFLLSVGSIGFRTQVLPSSEKLKIEILIDHVAEMKGAEFMRNGKAYDAATAATFLRRKWQANEAEVKTAQEFIDKVASSSGTSGKPYLIRFNDGKAIASRDFLLAKLKTIELSASDDRHSTGF